MEMTAKPKKGAKVRSTGPTVWPTGKVQDGVITGVIHNATPFGDRDTDSYVITWANGQISFPQWYPSDFTLLEG
jgi:hypothetical protein